MRRRRSTRKIGGDEQRKKNGEERKLKRVSVVEKKTLCIDKLMRNGRLWQENVKKKKSTARIKTEM